MSKIILISLVILFGNGATAEHRSSVPTATADKVVAFNILNIGSPQTSQYCCIICRKGKACGNSCIARWKTCHVGPGCACDE